MTHPLQPSDVLCRDPAAQLVALPDGRLLVRHAGGVSLLGGAGAAEVAALLARVDGVRTAAEVVGEGEERTRRITLLRRLLGEAVQRRGEAPAVAQAAGGETGRGLALGNGARIVGNGPGARRLAAATGATLVEVGAFAAATSTAFCARDREVWVPGSGEDAAVAAGEGVTVEEVAALLRGATAAVCVLEEVPYAALFALQRACLAARVASVWLTADPDGVRAGPAVVPGVTPCLACASAAGVRFLGGDGAAALPAFAHLRTLALPAGAAFDRAAALAADAAARLLAGDGEPRLVAETVRLAPSGAVVRALVPHLDGCPVCGTAPPPAAAGDAALDGAAVAAALRMVEVVEHAPRPRLLGEDAAAHVRTVGVVGGGTAGYLAALALRRFRPELAVTLIESRDVPVIGVGEATTPLMPQFLHVDLGLDVHRLFREVEPTLKLGIRFEWGAPEDPYFNYPFGPLHPLAARVYDGDVRSCSWRSLLMSAAAVPLFTDGAGGWHSRLDAATAYHLDNRRFVRYLQERARDAGVEAVDARIVDVAVTPDGEEVRRLVAADGRTFAFDLYLDCSGFRSLLLERALGSPFVSFQASLPTDAAVVAEVPRRGPLPPYTLAETLAAGWCWNTPQRDADHRGYVFCSSFLTPADAEAEMRRTNPGMGEARLIRFRAGRHADFWRGNVVALGNAYGFVEPLESTALHLLIRQIGVLVRAFPLRLGERGAPAVLNRRVNAWWDYLRWFLALHYRFNRRCDTPFWRRCQEDVDVSHCAELLTAFRERGTLAGDPALAAAFDAPDPLWGAEGVDLLLLGQRVPAPLPVPELSAAAWRRHVARCREVVGRSAPQEAALAALAAEPELLAGFADALTAVGPAFPAGERRR